MKSAGRDCKARKRQEVFKPAGNVDLQELVPPYGLGLSAKAIKDGNHLDRNRK
jgi:hypothetical protein